MAVGILAIVVALGITAVVAFRTGVRAVGKSLADTLTADEMVWLAARMQDRIDHLTREENRR